MSSILIIAKRKRFSAMFLSEYNSKSLLHAMSGMGRVNNLDVSFALNLLVFLKRFAVNARAQVNSTRNLNV